MLELFFGTMPMSLLDSMSRGLINIMGIKMDADWYGIIILYDLMNPHKVEMYHQVVLHF